MDVPKEAFNLTGSGKNVATENPPGDSQKETAVIRPDGGRGLDVQKKTEQSTRQATRQHLLGTKQLEKGSEKGGKFSLN